MKAEKKSDARQQLLDNMKQYHDEEMEKFDEIMEEIRRIRSILRPSR